MGLAALGIPAHMLTSTTNKEVEKFIYKALEKGEGELKILYVTPEKISKSKRFMSKLEKCHHAGRLSLVAIDVSDAIFSLCCQCQNICSSLLFIVRLSNSLFLIHGWPPHNEAPFFWLKLGCV
jgi:hypothetical protein